jgi:alpha-glucoside transport system permease protein
LLERVLLALAATLLAPALLVAYLAATEGLLGLLSRARQRALRPWFWLAPALVFLAIFLVLPTLQTAYLSLFDARSVAFVGLANYVYVLTDPAMLLALRNSALWLVCFTTITVSFGLLVAVLTDRVPYESTARAIIFLPMAISFVAAGVIWKFMYDYRPPGLPQTGTVNAALLALLPGFEPRAWLVEAPLNNLALILAAAWVWTGFCMVILAAALKGIPADLLEAAAVDGANVWQVFRFVVLPLLSPTVVVVATTMVITALKAFDIVYVMTNGNFETEVVANRMYKEMFNLRDFGRASAIAVALLIASLPVIALNLRRFREQETIR